MADVQATVIGIDVGTVRVGVAEGNISVGFAHPLRTLPAQTFADDFAKVVSEFNPSLVVVGLPRNLQGDDTPQTAYVREFAQQHLHAYDVIFQDEALTSVKAADELASRGGNHSKADVDALAATYILQDYFDEKRRGV